MVATCPNQMDGSDYIGVFTMDFPDLLLTELPICRLSSDLRHVSHPDGRSRSDLAVSRLIVSQFPRPQDLRYPDGPNVDQQLLVGTFPDGVDLCHASLLDGRSRSSLALSRLLVLRKSCLPNLRYADGLPISPTCPHKWTALISCRGFETCDVPTPSTSGTPISRCRISRLSADF
jgi:hypothetical protein